MGNNGLQAKANILNQLFWPNIPPPSPLASKTLSFKPKSFQHLRESRIYSFPIMYNR